MLFKNTRLKIRTTIERCQNAFHLLIAMLQSLVLAIDANSATIAANSATIAANTVDNSLLRAKLDTISEYAGYLARAKKSDLSRQGHQVV